MPCNEQKPLRLLWDLACSAQKPCSTNDPAAQCAFFHFRKKIVLCDEIGTEVNEKGNENKPWLRELPHTLHLTRPTTS